MILERGTLLNNRYRIVEILGQGGMGSVYKAVDENLGVEVAVKDNLFTTEEYARQFRREAVILANLRHPNLPRVTDHFVITGQGQYLVMDYIEGEDLRQRMDRVGVLPEEEVIIIGAAVCDALAYLGSRKPQIIHRDIKPGNIKITPQGHIFLVDFGLAKTLQGSQATTTGARAMTPGYSPPEQYGTARTDQRSDIFSLGATLYAAMTGATPEDALSRAMDQAELTSLRKQNPRISRRLSSVIEKSLEVRPDDRYQTAEDFKQALLSVNSGIRRKEGDFSVEPPPESEEVLPLESALLQPEISDDGGIGANGGQIQPFPTSTTLSDDEESRPRSRPLPRKRQRGVGCLLSMILFIIVLGGAGVVAYVLDPTLLARVGGQVGPIVEAVIATPTSQSAQVIADSPTWTLAPPTFTATIVTETATLVDTSTPTATFTDTPTPTETATPIPTPVGGGAGQIAYASDTTGVYQIYTTNIEGNERFQVTDIAEGACQPDFSPDGKRLVFISPCDGFRNYYPTSAMYLINVDGSGLQPLPASIGGDYDPAWSPDGRYIAFTSIRRSSRSQIFLLDLEDSSVVDISDVYSYDSQPAWSPDGSKLIFVSELQGTPELWVMDADGDNKTKFSRKSVINIRPHWSPDGNKILFTQLVSWEGIARLVMAPFDLENYVEFRVSQETIPMREGVFSPDGYWIAFEGWEVGGSHDIYVITVNGAGRRSVTNDPGFDMDPAWNPAQTK